MRRDRIAFRDYREALRFEQGVASTRDIFQASLRDLPGLYGPIEAALAQANCPAEQCFYTDDIEAYTAAAAEFGIRTHTYRQTDQLLEALQQLNVL